MTSDRQNASAIFSKDILSIFAEHLNDKGHEKIDVMIFTLGGDTLAAFGLNRLIREYTNHLSALIPDKCHSAGTLFALGCDQVLMSKVSSLGPVDPSIRNPLNPAVNINGQVQTLPLSVESVAGFKNLVRDEWGIKESSDVSQILKLLSDKVHPLALGEVYRSRQQIKFLATTLLEQHRKDSEKVQTIVQRLTQELGSHDYLIFRKEAKELLGEQAIINDKVGPLIRSLYKDFVNEMELGKPFNPNFILSSQPRERNEQGQELLRTASIQFKLATIESESRKDQFIERRHLKEVPMAQAPEVPPAIGVHQEILSSGWEECPS